MIYVPQRVHVKRRNVLVRALAADRVKPQARAIKDRRRGPEHL
jgi:hypothetical protein